MLGLGLEFPAGFGWLDQMSALGMRAASWSLGRGWVVTLGLALLSGPGWAQGEPAVGVIDRPLQIFVQPVLAEGVRAEVGMEESVFMVEVVRATLQADLARLLTQHVAPTRLVDRKARPQAPGWEVAARLKEVRRMNDGRWGMEVGVEVVDLRSTRTLLAFDLRSGLDGGVELPMVEDDGTVTPWNPPPERMRRKGVPDEVVEAAQGEATAVARRVVRRLAANLRQGR